MYRLAMVILFIQQPRGSTSRAYFSSSRLIVEASRLERQQRTLPTIDLPKASSIRWPLIVFAVDVFGSRRCSVLRGSSNLEPRHDLDECVFSFFFNLAPFYFFQQVSRDRVLVEFFLLVRHGGLLDDPRLWRTTLYPSILLSGPQRTAIPDCGRRSTIFFVCK